MSPKNEKDMGAAYLKEIGFSDLGEMDIVDRWVELFGKNRARELYAEWEKIGSGKDHFYSFKNSNPELSKSFSEVYDGTIIRKACNFIFKNKECFGKTILEVGCEAGYMTGFLAKTFPKSKIVAIERNILAIELAKKRIENLHLDNVEFRKCDLSDVPEQFDTVFCMRTLKENCNHSASPHDGEPLLYLFGTYKKLTRDYTRILVDHIKDSGNLCVFERISHDPLLCGWLLELEKTLCGLKLETYEEVQCAEAAVTNTFQSFVAQKGHVNSLKQILDLWYAPVSNYNSSMTFLSGWKALDYLNRNAGSLIRGVRIFKKGSSHQVGRLALFTDSDNEPTIYFLVSTGCAENIKLYSFDASQKDDALHRLQELIDDNIRAGFCYEEIGPDDKIVEGRIRLGFVKKA